MSELTPDYLYADSGETRAGKRSDYRKDATLIRELKTEADRLSELARLYNDAAEKLEAMETIARASETLAEAQRRLRARP